MGNIGKLILVSGGFALRAVFGKWMSS